MAAQNGFHLDVHRVRGEREEGEGFGDLAGLRGHVDAQAVLFDRRRHVFVRDDFGDEPLGRLDAGRVGTGIGTDGDGQADRSARLAGNADVLAGKEGNVHGDGLARTEGGAARHVELEGKDRLPAVAVGDKSGGQKAFGERKGGRMRLEPVGRHEAERGRQPRFARHAPIGVPARFMMKYDGERVFRLRREGLVLGDQLDADVGGLLGGGRPVDGVEPARVRRRGAGGEKRSRRRQKDFPRSHAIT